MNAKRSMKKLAKNAQAVSPVIATLMLVLVSVAAAGSFYAWQTTWQEDRTGDLGAGARTTLTIDGSSTVYEFSVVAAKMYESKNPDTKISVTVTGSGAGREAARTGRVDIGSASSDTDPDEYPVDLNNDGSPDIVGELLVTTVAKDGVTMCTNHLNIASEDINKTTLTAVYLVNLGYWTAAQANDNYSHMPDTANGTNGGYTDIDMSWGSTNSTILVGYRSHESGTQECFSSSATNIKSITGEKQLVLDGIGDETNTVSGPGNSELMDAIESSSEPVLSFCSLSEVDASDVVTKLTFESVEAKESNIADGSYKASRPLQYLTIDMDEDGEIDPGVAKDYIEFCLIPEINDAVCTEAGYTSLYA